MRGGRARGEKDTWRTMDACEFGGLEAEPDSVFLAFVQIGVEELDGRDGRSGGWGLHPEEDLG